MTDYKKRGEALRHCVSDENGVTKCAGCPYYPDITGCMDRLHTDAAAAIEDLQAEQKKTVTQIFGEEQMAWEGRCKDLMKYISDLQAEIRESMQKCAECGDEQEQKVKELQAEVDRLVADVDAAYRH